MADVFISYASADRERIESLAAAIEAAGYSVWWDRNILSGAEFSKDIQKSLEQAGVAVVAWSKSAIESHWVKDEAEYARANGKLASVTLDGTPPPLGFRQFQCTDISPFKGDAAALTLLLASIGQKLGAAPAPPAKSPPTRPRKRMLIAATVAAGVLLGAGTYFAATGGKDRSVVSGAHDAVKAGADPSPAAPTRSVAVMPFLSLSSVEEDGYFADGLTEEILNSLATIPGLLVTARTSSFYFKGKDLPIPEIAAKLGVAHVIEGSLRPAGDKVRITVQLIRASDGTHLWSQIYDRAPDDILGVQSEIAERVAGAFGVLLDDKQRQAMKAQGVSNIDAFVAYQKGAALFYDAHGFGPFMEKLSAAQSELEKAIEAEPEFAAARLMHAAIYNRLLSRAIYGAPSPKEFPAKSAGELQRLLIDDLNAAARYARTPGRRLMAEFAAIFSSDDWTGLSGRMDALLASEECLGNLGWTHYLQNFGRLIETTSFMERRRACDPYDPGAFGTLMDLHLNARAFAAVRDDIVRGRELFGQRRPYAVTEFYLAVSEGKFAEAHRLLAGLNPGFHTWGQLMLAIQEGDAARIPGLSQTARSESAQAPWDLLVIAAWTGDREAAAKYAAQLDRDPVRWRLLLDSSVACLCGQPFPLKAAPNFARRLEAAGLTWNPPSPMTWPDKDW